jgi:hypothetical protein
VTLGQYKVLLEEEKHAFERKLNEERQRNEVLQKESQVMKEEFDQMVEDYEKKLEEVCC